jgi:phosphate-selective porin OprO/OprP
MVNRTFAEERIYLGAGAFANTDEFGNEFANDSNYNVTARLTGLPLYVDEGKQLLHVGVNYSHQFRGDGSLSFSQRPEAHLAPKIVNTGTINGVSGVDLVGGELAGVFGPVNFQSEIVSSFVDRGRGLTNPSFWGAYGQVGWFLTGETRAYDPVEAAFVRTSPKHSFSIKDGTWGAWELAARYSYLTLADKGVGGGIVSDITGGLSWYLYPNLRLMVNYVYSNRHGLGDASIAESRVQVDF